MNRTRVKICGITRPEDGIEAARLGADAIGLVFYPASPRVVDIRRAARILEALPPFVTTVGLFVDERAEAIRAVLDALTLDLLQFHGSEPPEACGAFGRPYIKALRMRDGVDVRAEAERYAGAAGILLDAYRKGAPGGTGHRFDWTRVPRNMAKPIILAGGIDADNVAAGIAAARPFAVDVSSGVETAKGIKDPGRMEALITAVSAADRKNR